MDWREGQPFHLTPFITETLDAQEQAGIALHELYHVLATRWRLGGKSPRGFESPWLGGLYEEIAASLLADCGRLQVADRLVLPEGNMTLTLNGSKTSYKGSVDAEGLAFLLDPARTFKFAPGLVTNLVHRTALLAFDPEGKEIVAGTDRARQLLALCHDAIRDPWQLERWFRDVAGRQSRG